jgi:hypothetical protein
MEHATDAGALTFKFTRADEPPLRGTGRRALVLHSRDLDVAEAALARRALLVRAAHRG